MLSMPAPLSPGSRCLARSIEHCVPLTSLTVPMPAQAFEHANKHANTRAARINYLAIAVIGLIIAVLLERTVIVL